jgi:AAA domain
VSTTVNNGTDPGFSRLQVADWRQFSSIDIQFHPRLTVLTGANASGKTTLLNILGRHFNWNAQYLSVPVRSRSGAIQWSTNRKLTQTRTAEIGSLTYTDGASTPILAPVVGTPSYDLTVSSQQNVPGIFISAHRSTTSYQPLQTLPTQFLSSASMLAGYSGELFSNYGGRYSGRSPMLQMKEALISAAIFGEGNRSVEPVAEAADVWEGFTGVLRRLLPLLWALWNLRFECRT